MKNKKFLFLTALCLMLIMVLAACGGEESTETEGTTSEENATEGATEEKTSDIDFLSLVTGGTQGTYYALGGTFADLITDETGIKTTAEVSQASAANVNALKEGNAEIAFVQTDIAYYAKNGQLMFEGAAVEDLVAIGGLYPETIHLVTTANSGIASYEDLKGKKVSVGAPGSGTYANAEQLLEIHGLTMDDIQPQNLDFGESTDGLQTGQIDAAFVTAGYPTAAVEALGATTDVVIVPVAADKAEALIAKYPYYAVDTIPAGTYGLETDVPTVSVLAMLAVKADLPEDVAYGITKAIYGNTDKISHAKGSFIKAETALDGIGIDVHPGAQKYFDEQ
ncbi:TAXI family TRAP transporter solute-binding subunit [Lysinibacillus telephonicus]|uniref:TAXI family TRAP transporter solute-binding subunit n=1 Tax=Lysinibacillus telephonicus TaxID=1714840 RepID=A0A3S0HHM4_9BACI|nr:TAXI family TRAP transporter solute-binding subunit [Lysinibacillus telephonicus]RTQ90475.1 TAXI family TRAP transporter solute-binding subunit [Lysinibacillus telephonicus]